MRKILYTILALFLTIGLSAQFTDRPGKIQLGYQTTANGLVCLVDSIPDFTPSDKNDCFLAQDTTANKIYIYKPSLASWEEFSPDTGLGILDSIAFNDTLMINPGRGVLAWNNADETLDLGINGVILQIGQEMFAHVKNQTGATIDNGAVVRYSGALGASGRITGDLMIADGTFPAMYTLGIATEAIPNGEDGFVTVFGVVRGVNTSAYDAGDILYVSTTVEGALTDTVPESPNPRIPIAVVLSSGSNGSIFVRPTLFPNLNEINDVDITSATSGQVLRYDGTKWINSTERDTSDTNEIQYLVFSNDTLGLTDDPTSVVLPYLDQAEISEIIGDTSTLLRNYTDQAEQDAKDYADAIPETDPVFQAESPNLVRNVDIAILDTTISSDGTDLSAATLETLFDSYQEIRIDAQLEVGAGTNFIISLVNADSVRQKKLFISGVDNSSTYNIIVSGIQGNPSYQLETGESIYLQSQLIDGAYEWVFINQKSSPGVVFSSTAPDTTSVWVDNSDNTVKIRNGGEWDRAVTENDYEVFEYTDVNIDSATINSIMINRERPVIEYQLSDTATTDRNLTLPVGTSGEIEIRSLSSSSSSYLKIIGDIKLKNNYISSYRVESGEKIKIKKYGGFWRVESNYSYPDQYRDNKTYDFTKTRLGEYIAIGSARERNVNFASSFSEYNLLSIPLKPKYTGVENRILASNNVGRLISPHGWKANNASDPGLLFDYSGYIGPKGVKDAVLVETLTGSASWLAYMEEPIDSAQIINVSFWMKMVSDDTLTVLLRGPVVNPYGEGNIFSMAAPGMDNRAYSEVEVSSKTWKRYNVNLVGQVPKSLGRSEVNFIIQDGIGGGAKFLWGNTTVRLGTEPSFEVITGKDFFYDGQDSMKLYLNPTDKGLVNTSDLIIPEGVNTRKVWQQVLDYCQETENCSGLYISGQHEIDSTIIVHHGQTIKSDYSVDGPTVKDPDKIANPSRIEFNPPDSLPDLVLFRADSIGRRGGETKPKSKNFENLYILVQDTCRAVFELESSNEVLIDDVGIDGQDFANAGIAFTRVGHALEYGRASLFCNIEDVTINNTGTALDLDIANYIAIKDCRLTENDIGISIENSGRVYISDTWFESNIEGDIVCNDSRQLVLHRNYFERSAQSEIEELADYSITVLNSSIVSLYDNSFLAANYLDGYVYLDTVQVATFMGNNMDNSNLYNRSGIINTEVVEINNVQRNGSDQKNQVNTIQGLVVKENIVKNSKISNGNTLTDQQFISELNLTGNRENLMLYSDTVITFDQSNGDFLKIDTTIISPFMDSISGCIWEQKVDINFGSERIGYSQGTGLTHGLEYEYSFWARIINKTDSSDGVGLAVTQWNSTNSSQFTISDEWEEYEFTFTADSSQTLAGAMVYNVLPLSTTGDQFAIAKGSLREAGQNMGYVETTNQAIDDKKIVINLPVDSTLYIEGDVNVSGDYLGVTNPTGGTNTLQASLNDLNNKGLQDILTSDPVLTGDNVIDLDGNNLDFTLTSTSNFDVNGNNSYLWIRDQQAILSATSTASSNQARFTAAFGIASMQYKTSGDTVFPDYIEIKEDTISINHTKQVNIDAPVVEINGESVVRAESERNASDTTSGTGSITVSHSLGVVPSVTIANASATPYLFTIDSVTTTDFTFTVYDTSGSSVNSTSVNFDYQLIIP